MRCSSKPRWSRTTSPSYSMCLDCTSRTGSAQSDPMRRESSFRGFAHSRQDDATPGRYSARNASTGSIPAARSAGRIPAITPITSDNPADSTMKNGEKLTGSLLTS